MPNGGTGEAIYKDGSQMGAQQTTNAPDYQKMVVRQSRLNQQMHQTNEDVAMWQPTMAQAKCRCDDTAIKKCASQM
jgi:outer membrane murein-binding lipoprotein Lpp